MRTVSEGKWKWISGDCNFSPLSAHVPNPTIITPQRQLAKIYECYNTAMPNGRVNIHLNTSVLLLPYCLSHRLRHTSLSKTTTTFAPRRRKRAPPCDCRPRPAKCESFPKLAARARSLLENPGNRLSAGVAEKLWDRKRFCNFWSTVGPFSRKFAVWVLPFYCQTG